MFSINMIQKDFLVKNNWFKRMDFLKIKNNKSIERLNKSFNYNGINNPKISFYSIEMIKKFMNLKTEVNYENYYNFLNNILDFDNLLNKLVAIWRERNSKIFREDLKIPLNMLSNDIYLRNYLIKKFVIDPIDGILIEKGFNESLKIFFKNYAFIEPTPEQDANECFDIKLINEFNSFSFQVKPKSFFVGLKNKKTVMHSLSKIESASKKYKNPIFLVQYDGKDYRVLVLNKTGFVFKKIDKAYEYFANATNEQLLSISHYIFKILG